MNIPGNLYYTKDHEWARIEGKTALVGITDFAQSSLGDITFVDLPKMASSLKQREPCSTVESVKAASDVYAPLSGVVVSVNTELAAHPEMVNKAPYESGYFFKIEIKDENEVKNLMDAAAYKRHLETLV